MAGTEVRRIILSMICVPELGNSSDTCAIVGSIFSDSRDNHCIQQSEYITHPFLLEAEVQTTELLKIQVGFSGANFIGHVELQLRVDIDTDFTEAEVKQ